MNTDKILTETNELFELKLRIAAMRYFEDAYVVFHFMDEDGDDTFWTNCPAEAFRYFKAHPLETLYIVDNDETTECSYNKFVEKINMLNPYAI